MCTNNQPLRKVAGDKASLPRSVHACVLAAESVVEKKKKDAFPAAMENYVGINLMRNACDLYKDNYKILLAK